MFPWDTCGVWRLGAAELPAFVQNRCYARLGWDRVVRQFCRAHNIVYQGFSLLTANQEVLQLSDRQPGRKREPHAG